MLDFINSNKFADIAHVKFHPQSGFGITKEWQKNCIIFTKPDHISQLFQEIQLFPYKYILITHSSDYQIDQRRFISKPANIIKWFGLNATYDHPDLIPIPYGLEAHKTEYGAVRGEVGPPHFKWFLENLERLKHIKKDIETIYASFKVDYNFASGVWTNPHRKNIIPDFNVNGLKYFRPSNGKLAYKEYLEVGASYKFHVVPIGNGIDNHRTPELLYINCIPIVLTNRIYRDWNLPILQINNWSELTNEFLKEKSKNIIKEPWDLLELTLKYWKNKIESEFKKL